MDWSFMKNNIYNENCITTILKMVPNSIDLVLTSPPYDNLRDYGGEDWNFDIFMEIAELLYTRMKPGGVIVWIVGDATVNGSESGTSFRQALFFKSCGLFLHDTMIWNKPNFANPSSNRYHQIFEYMFIFSKGKPKTFNPIKDKVNKYTKPFGKNSNRGKDGEMQEQKLREYPKQGMRNNVWNINTSGQENPCTPIEHPATFSEQIAHDHIISWSNEDDLVYDPFLGSGTTCAVAKKLNRNYIGSEIHTPYFIQAGKRIEETKTQLTLI